MRSRDAARAYGQSMMNPDGISMTTLDLRQSHKNTESAPEAPGNASATLLMWVAVPLS